MAERSEALSWFARHCRAIYCPLQWIEQIYSELGRLIGKFWKWKNWWINNGWNLHSLVSGKWGQIIGQCTPGDDLRIQINLVLVFILSRYWFKSIIRCPPPQLLGGPGGIFLYSLSLSPVAWLILAFGPVNTSCVKDLFFHQAFDQCKQVHLAN